jgi:uncharacterized membrane protein
MEDKKDSVNKKTQTPTKKALIWLGLYGLIVFVLLFIVIAVFYVIKLFPDYVPINSADNLLQIWITTNGVLMGFVGIIFAQLLSSTMDLQNTLFQRILESEHHSKKREELLKKRIKYLDNRKIALSACTALSLILIAFSILLSMQGLAKNSLLGSADTFAVTGFMFGPLFSSVLGMAFLIVAFLLPSTPPLQGLDEN